MERGGGGQPHGSACAQIDIGKAATEMTERMTAGIPQADGTKMVEPRMDAPGARLRSPLSRYGLAPGVVRPPGQFSGADDPSPFVAF